jgi:hypothetical protein
MRVTRLSPRSAREVHPMPPGISSVLRLIYDPGESARGAG